MSSQSPWINAGLFALATGVIWFAGTRLERLADVLSRRTGLGQAFMGVALLAAATSLPEVATTVTAVVLLDNPSLAVHNLLGGVALQTGLLIFADLVQKERGALTYFAPRYSLLLQGIGLLFLLQLAITGVAAKGTPSVWGVSVFSVLLLLAQLGVLYLTWRHRGRPRWTPTNEDDVPAEEEPEEEPEEEAADPDPRSLTRLWAGFAAMSGLVLAAGWLATRCADGLAESTGLGDAFIGATLLALATSAPEVSTTFAASRTGRYTLAVSNVFGSNAFDVSLIFWADLLYRQGSVLAHAEPTVIFVGALGSAMTCLFLLGLVERENKTVGRLGWDSVAALLLYAGGVAVLYFIQ